MRPPRWDRRSPTRCAPGLEGLGVTDHDTTAAFDEAIGAAEGTGLEVVLGTEFSAEDRGHSVHVLGYWIDPHDAALMTLLDRLRNEPGAGDRGEVRRAGGSGEFRAGREA